MDEGQTVGDRITARMKRLGMKNTTLADAIGVSDKTVSAWRNDRFPPDQSKVPAIARLLGVSPSWLLYGTDQLAMESPRTSFGASFRGGAVAGVAGGGKVSQTPARDLRILASEFELEALRRGATEEDLDYIKLALRSPEAVQMYAGGYNGRLTEQEQRLELASLIQMLRTWLEERIARRAAR